MDPRRLFLFGVFGGALMTMLMTFARLLGLPMSFELLLGTLVGIPPGLVAWIVGLGIHLALSGLIALVYGWAFEHLPPHHAGRDVGMLYSLAHVFIAGTLLSAIPLIHPAMPGVLEEPGPFYAERGLIAVLLFFVAHVIYGAVVGEGAARRSVRRTTTARSRSLRRTRSTAHGA